MLLVPAAAALFGAAAALVSLLPVAAAATSPSDLSNVVDLTPENFDKIVDGSRSVLVEFYAPWCGHCKTLAPVYEEVATGVARSKELLAIAKVDADQHKSLASRFGVKGFPTLKWFPKGSTKPEEYQGGRTADDLYRFIEDKTAIRPNIKHTPTFVKVITEEDFDTEVVHSGKHVLVEFYAPWCGHCKSLAPIYEKVAKAFASEPNCVVANINAESAQSIASRYDVKGYPTLKFFRAGSAGVNPIEFDSSRDEAGMIAFLNRVCGTHRVVGGGLDSVAGRIAEFDAYATKFMSATAANRPKHLGEAKTASQSNHATKYANYYVKVMEKVMKSGDGFVGKEMARLTKVLDKGVMSGVKADDFHVRRNILGVFGGSGEDQPEASDEL